MVRAVLATAVLAGAPALAEAQSASAPLMVSATVVSACKVDVNVPQSPGASGFVTWPVAVTCANRGLTPRVQRPVAPRRSEARGAVLTIDF